MKKEFIHALILILAVMLTFFLPRTYLTRYDVQISAVLFIILFISRRFKTSRLLESVIFTLIVLIIINSTGQINSPFFFLVYFLLFSLSLLLEPVISITTTLTLIVFFLLSLPENQDLKSLLPVLSLAFLTPFAMFMGEEYKKNLKLKTKTEQLQQDTGLFLSLMLKNHLKAIKHSLDNFMGDHDLHQIKKQTTQMEKLIDNYEKGL